MAYVREDERVISTVSNPDVKNDAAPKGASNSQRVFLMGSATHALTGRAARHENTEKCFWVATLS